MLLYCNMPDIVHLILSQSPILKYGLLFIIAVVEGPLITILAGWLSFLGHLNIWFAYSFVLLGELVADSLYYALGFYGKEKMFRWFPKTLGKSRDKIEKFEKLLHAHVGKTLVITKLTHVGGIPSIIAAGLAKVPFSKFSFYNTLASIPKIFLLFLVGYFFGSAAGKINRYLEYGGFIATILVIIFIINYFFLIPFTKKKFRKSK